MICFNGSDLISLKANNGLLQPRLQDDDDDDDDDESTFRPTISAGRYFGNRLIGLLSVNKVVSSNRNLTTMIR